jgi:hypothetical protein
LAFLHQAREVVSAVSSKFNIAIVIFTSVVSLAQAVDLVVTKDNRSFWAQNVRTNGTMLSFVLNENGKNTNTPLNEIDVVVPGVERGRKYSDDEVSGVLKIILNTRAGHNGLMKQLKILQNEWEAIRATSDQEIEKGIAETMAAFKTNKNSKSTYDNAILKLSMMRCKDVSGVHSSQLDNALGSIQEQYLGVNIRQLEANAAKMTIDEFAKIRDPATVALKKEVLSPEEKKQLVAALDKARAAILSKGLADASDAVATDKSIDSYLKSRTILVQLKKEVAGTTDQKSAVDKALSSMIMGVKSAQSDYELGSNGYPLNKKDRDTLAITRAYSSTQLIFGTPVDEQCLIIVNEVPKPVPAGNQAIIPMTLVFNRLGQDSREYCMVVSGAGGNESAKRRARLPVLSLRDGHVDLPFALDFSSKEQQVTPLRDNDGPYVLVHLAYRPSSDNNRDENVEWKAISLACRIPVAD